MKLTQSHHTIKDVIENLETLMSHMQKLINDSGQTKSIKNTKLGKMHNQLVNIKNLIAREGLSIPTRPGRTLIQKCPVLALACADTARGCRAT